MAGEKVKLLCSFGGDMVSGEHGKPNYVGGKTRLVSIERSASFRSLLAKMADLCGAGPGDVDIKYQLPDGGFCNSRLVSVENDDDVRNMMDEFDSNQKIPIFLFMEKEEEEEEDEAGDPHMAFGTGTAPLIESGVVNAARENIRCAADGCTWRVHASKLPQVSTFRIRTLTPDHTCVRSENAGHRQATAKWIANCIRDKLRQNRNYKPREILNDIHREYGVLITYKRAFLGREKALEELHAEPPNPIVDSNFEAFIEDNHTELTEVQAWGEIHDPPQKKRVYKPRHPQEVRPLHCTRCNQMGHNRRTCVIPEPMQDEVG